MANQSKPCCLIFDFHTFSSNIPPTERKSLFHYLNADEKFPVSLYRITQGTNCHLQSLLYLSVQTAASQTSLYTLHPHTITSMPELRLLLLHVVTILTPVCNLCYCPCLLLGNEHAATCNLRHKAPAYVYAGL